MIEHEVLVIGAGHNELAVAAYLAKAGVDVGVLERRDFVGGGTQTREVTLPGFKQETDSVVHIMIQSNPMILNDELQLKSKYGLDYIYPDVQYGNVFPDGSSFCIYPEVEKTCESIAKISPHDGDNYMRFFQYARTVLNFITPALFSPPAPFGQVVSMLDSSPEGQEILRALLASTEDIVNDWFEDERVKVGMMKVANEAMLFPDSYGGGVELFLMIPMIHLNKLGIPRGGGVQLPLSMVRCIEDHGGKIHLNSEVTKVKVEGGRAVGVVLSSGEEMRAKKAVVCGLHPKILFNKLLDDTSPELLHKVNRLKPSDHSTLTANYALNAPPQYKAGGDVNRAILVEILPFMDDFMAHYQECRMGLLPTTPVPYIACHSLYDPSKAPDGKASIQFYDPAPYRLRDGGPQKWDEVKEQQEDRKLEWVRKFTTNMGSENILDRHIFSPLDMERWNPNYIEGDVAGIGLQLYQFLSNRPIPELSQYTTPVDGLFLCGPCTHPGGGVMGGGRAAVQAIMEKLGIDFDKVIA